MNDTPITKEYSIALVYKQCDELRDNIGNLTLPELAPWSNFIYDLCVRLEKLQEKCKEVEASWQQ